MAISHIPAHVRPTRAVDEDVGGDGKAGKPRGSAGHATGVCKPCSFFASKNGCNNGTECKFCHLDHKKKKSRPSRPSKNTRIQCMQIAAILEKAADPGSSKVPENMSRLTVLIQRNASAIRQRRSEGELDDTDGEGEQRQQQRTRSRSESPPLNVDFSSGAGTSQLCPLPFSFCYFCGSAVARHLDITQCVLYHLTYTEADCGIAV